MIETTGDMQKGVTGKMSLGLIQEYNPEWPNWFKRIKQPIAIKLKNIHMAIEHVGSTSIEGMNAKPVIDIDVIIKEEDFISVRSKLQDLGYLHQGDLGIKGRESFRMTAGKDLPAHHLYVCYVGAYELQKHISFRDYLRENDEDKNKLMELKRNLEETCRTREEYIENKAGLVQEITIKALKKYKS